MQIGQAVPIDSWITITACEARLGSKRRRSLQVLEQLVTRIGVWGTDIKVLLPGFGAMTAGFARERRCGDAVATVRRYHELGGVPDKRMYDTVLTACLTAGEVCFPLACILPSAATGLSAGSGFRTPGCINVVLSVRAHISIKLHAY